MLLTPQVSLDLYSTVEASLEREPHGDEPGTTHQGQCPCPSRSTSLPLPVPSSTSDTWTSICFLCMDLVMLRAAKEIFLEKQPFLSVCRERAKTLSSGPGQRLCQQHPHPPSSAHLPADLQAAVFWKSITIWAHEPDVPGHETGGLGHQPPGPGHQPAVPGHLAQAGLDPPLDRLPIGVPVG